MTTFLDKVLGFLNSDILEPDRASGNAALLISLSMLTLLPAEQQQIAMQKALIVARRMLTPASPTAKLIERLLEDVPQATPPRS